MIRGRGAVGFLMALYQRRLASSTRAVRKSLENRARRLELGLKHAQQLARTAPPDLPDWDELEEMEEEERERLEEMLEAITLAGNAAQVREEIAELLELAGQAQEVEDSTAEAKLSKLKDLLQKEGFFDHTDRRLLLFTEFKDTLDYLVEKLEAWGFRVGCIHGSMKSGSRDAPGTRLYSEQQFREGEIQVLIATEAAGEGINLQVCNILFNYDIPWNPNRLEQRMGRIHRYGQRKDCLIFNFVATNTIEGRVLQRLLEKLQEIRDALDDDAVFNVVGEILPSAHVERVLRDYYAGKLGDTDLEERLLEDVGRRALPQYLPKCLGRTGRQEAQPGNADRASGARQGVPTRPGIHRAIYPRGSGLCPVQAQDGREPSPHFRAIPNSHVVATATNATPTGKLPELANRYPRCSTDRDAAEEHNLEWVTPGHPLFGAIRRHTREKALEPFGRGACFYSLQHDEPARLDFYRARVVDGLGQIVHERLFAVELTEGSEPQLREPSMLGDFTPGEALEEPPPALAAAPEPTPMAARARPDRLPGGDARGEASRGRPDRRARRDLSHRAASTRGRRNRPRGQHGRGEEHRCRGSAGSGGDPTRRASGPPRASVGETSNGRVRFRCRQ